MSGVAARLAVLSGRIASACARAGRDPAAVTLVAASKLQPAERLQEAWAAGVRVFGENRVQEAEGKRPLLPAAATWHLLGPLQSNKARRAAALFDVIEAVDRPAIAASLAREAARLERRLPVLLEVNVAREASKHGFPPEALPAAAAALAGLPQLRLMGLMAIPPPAGEPEASRPWFRRLRGLRDELLARPEGADCPGWLSMGMSDDFEVAIEEGATHVRIGTALFGPRPGAGRGPA